MESGQSPDGLGRDSHHRRRSCRSLRSPCSSAVSAIVGRGSQDLEGHPAPPMSGRLSRQTPTGKISVLVFCFLCPSRFYAQQVGKLRVSLVPTSSLLQQPRQPNRNSFSQIYLQEERSGITPERSSVLRSLFALKQAANLVRLLVWIRLRIVVIFNWHILGCADLVVRRHVK